jgi:hypothetical protein
MAMDRVFLAFLRNTASEARELQSRSDVAILDPDGPCDDAGEPGRQGEATAHAALPPCAYTCTFRVPYLRRLPSGVVDVHPGPVVCGVRFPEDYLRCIDPMLFLKIASVFNPDFLHPNVLAGAVCLGSRFAPGTPITGLIWELYEIVTYRNCTVDERDALNPEACRLIREYPALREKLERPRLFRSPRRLPLLARPT